jgi:hypothetical protein
MTLDRMTLNSGDLSTIARQEFCLALKTARERKGLTLAQISETTKIPASLFAGLERHDLRHWPKGLFRRSFFRDYAKAIGLPVTETCAEFVRLFPEEDGTEVSEPPKQPREEPGQEEELRLVLDASWAAARGHTLADVLEQVSKAIRAAWRSVGDVISEGFLRPEADRSEPPQRLRVRIKVPK